MAYKRSLREITFHVSLHWLLTNPLIHKAGFVGQIAFASQGCQAQRSLGKVPQACFCEQSHAFNENTIPLDFPICCPELFSTISIFKAPLPFPHSSSAWVAYISPMLLANKDFFLNHFHIWRYFLLGHLALVFAVWARGKLQHRVSGYCKHDGCLVCLYCTWPLFQTCTKWSALLMTVTQVTNSQQQ